MRWTLLSRLNLVGFIEQPFMSPKLVYISKSLIDAYDVSFLDNKLKCYNFFVNQSNIALQYFYFWYFQKLNRSLLSFLYFIFCRCWIKRITLTMGCHRISVTCKTWKENFHLTLRWKLAEKCRNNHLMRNRYKVS